MAPDIESSRLVGALMGVGGLVGALLYVRRQLSRDSTGLASDKSERSQISRLEAEIVRVTTAAEAEKSRADRWQAQHTADAQRCAFLDAENTHLTRERDRLMRDIRRAVRALPDDVRDVLETDFSALADVDERVDAERK